MLGILSMNFSHNNSYRIILLEGHLILIRYILDKQWLQENQPPIDPQFAMRCRLDPQHILSSILSSWNVRGFDTKYIFILMLTCWMKNVTSTTVANQKITVWQWTYPLPLSLDFFSLIPFLRCSEGWSLFSTSCLVFMIFILKCTWTAQCLKLYCTVTAFEHHMKNSLCYYAVGRAAGVNHPSQFPWIILFWLRFLGTFLRIGMLVVPL